MKKLPILIFIFWLFSVSAFAQEAKLFDRFGTLYCDDIMARLDYFAIELHQLPNTFGLVISYEGNYLESGYDRKGNLIKEDKSVLPMFGESTERTHTMMNYIFRFRGFPREKIIFVNGGFRENYTVEFWIVPKGADLPKIEPTLKSIKYRKGTPPDICKPEPLINLL